MTGTDKPVIESIRATEKTPPINRKDFGIHVFVQGMGGGGGN